jgi:hypothetical protein
MRYAFLSAVLAAIPIVLLAREAPAQHRERRACRTRAKDDHRRPLPGPALLATKASPLSSGDASLTGPQCSGNVPHIDGTWTTLPYPAPINPIGTTLLRTGKVLLVAGSENDSSNNSTGSESYRAAVWDPTGTSESSFTVQHLIYDTFCSGAAVLPDGRALIVGGSSTYQFTGENRASIFDPETLGYLQAQAMVDGRWYATVTALGDGRLMAWSGLNSLGGTNSSVEIYSLRAAGTGWAAPITGSPTPPLFPRMTLLPNGTVFWSGQGTDPPPGNAWIFDPVNATWTVSVPTTMDRHYGSSVLLPLLPPSYAPRVMNFGGGDPATPTTEIIDLSASSPAWIPGPPMSTGRLQMNAILLADGTVLAEGGSVTNETPDAPGLHADLYEPGSNTFASGGTAAYSRLYHSTALLLPDATVASLGSNPGPHANYQPAIEIYTPAYLYDANDRPISATSRPLITGVSPPGPLAYGQTVTVSYAQSTTIASAALVRPGSTTHAFNMDQRFVGLCGASPQPACAASNGSLSLTMPPNGNIAPPGYYMLFLFDATGVPSIATFVQLSAQTSIPPSSTIASPSGDVTINPGDSVSFSTAATGLLYSWIFPGGSPATSTAQNPGAVTFSSPGDHVVSLTVIDANGNSDPSPPTRKVTVLPPSADFDVAVSQPSQVVLPGQTAQFNVSITALSGFSGVVTLSVGTETGFPAGVTSGGFSPSTITGSGTSTLTMDTTSSTLPYALTLTVTGTSGTLWHTASTTLVVLLEAPPSLQATAGNGQATLTWPAVPAATGYHVKRSTIAGGPYLSVGCPTSTTFTDTGVVNGTTYFYVVSAFFTGGLDAGGESANSPEASVTPTAPTTTTTLSVSNASVDFDDPVALTAQLSVPVAGQSIAFSAAGQTCSGITDANGVASCAITPQEPTGSYAIAATFAGSSTLAASQGSATLTVNLEQASLTYTGDTTITSGGVARMSCTLLEDGVTPIAGHAVTFTLGAGTGAQTCGATTDATGAASCNISPVAQALGTVGVAAAFAGDSFYPAATATASVTVNAPPPTTTTLSVSNASADFDDPVALTAQLSVAVAGQSIIFNAAGQTCSGVTNANGVASCTITPQVGAGSYTIAATFAGSSTLAPSQGAAKLTVSREQTQLTYTGATTLAAGGVAHMSATLVEDGVTAIAGRTITFTLGTGTGAQTCSATTGAGGAASCSISSVAQAVGTVSVVAAFAGDAFYPGTTATASARVRRRR